MLARTIRVLDVHKNGPVEAAPAFTYKGPVESSSSSHNIYKLTLHLQIVHHNILTHHLDSSYPDQMTTPTVLISGAGLGGLFLAILLDKANIPYHIYEKAPHVVPLGKQDSGLSMIYGWRCLSSIAYIELTPVVMTYPHNRSLNWNQCQHPPGL